MRNPFTSQETETWLKPFNVFVVFTESNHSKVSIRECFRPSAVLQERQRATEIVQCTVNHPQSGGLSCVFPVYLQYEEIFAHSTKRLQVGTRVLAYSYCMWTQSCTTLEPWLKPLFFCIYRGIESFWGFFGGASWSSQPATVFLSCPGPPVESLESGYYFPVVNMLVGEPCPKQVGKRALSWGT